MPDDLVVIVIIGKRGDALPKSWYDEFYDGIMEKSKTKPIDSFFTLVETLYGMYHEFLQEKLLNDITEGLGNIVSEVAKLDEVIHQGFDEKTVNSSLDLAITLLSNLKHIETLPVIGKNDSLEIARDELFYQARRLMAPPQQLDKLAFLPAAIFVAEAKVAFAKKGASLFPENREEELRSILEENISIFGAMLLEVNPIIDKRFGGIEFNYKYVNKPPRRTGGPEGGDILDAEKYVEYEGTYIFDNQKISVFSDKKDIDSYRWWLQTDKLALEKTLSEAVSAEKEKLYRKMDPTREQIRKALNYWKAMLAGQSIDMMLLDILGVNLSGQAGSHAPRYSLPLPNHVENWCMKLGTDGYEKVRSLIAASSYGMERIKQIFNRIASREIRDDELQIWKANLAKLGLKGVKDKLEIEFGANDVVPNVTHNVESKLVKSGF